VLHAATRPFLYVHPHSKTHPQRHTAWSQRELHTVSERLSQALRQSFPPARINSPHPRDVPLQFAVLDQRGNRRFGRQVSLNVEQ
jgi:hypothetical protein